MLEVLLLLDLSDRPIKALVELFRVPQLMLPHLLDGVFKLVNLVFILLNRIFEVIHGVSYRRRSCILELNLGVPHA